MPLIPHHFFEQDIPAFIKAIERIAKAIELTNDKKPEVAFESGGKLVNLMGFIEKLADHLATIEGQLETLLHPTVREVPIDGAITLDGKMLKKLLYQAVGAIPLPDRRSSTYKDILALTKELMQLADKIP